MQIIGIYLDTADTRVRKSLKEHRWYPYGKFLNCHDYFSERKITEENQKNVLDEIKKIKTLLMNYINLVIIKLHQKSI